MRQRDAVVHVEGEWVYVLVADPTHAVVALEHNQRIDVFDERSTNTSPSS